MANLKILIAALLFSVSAQAQNNMADKWIIIDSAWGRQMKDSIYDDGVHRYQFGTTLKTSLGRWVTPCVNILWFTFPDSGTYLKLPSEKEIILIDSLQ